MATYTTDLTTLTTNDTDSWAELPAPHSSGAASSLDNETFIQGTGSNSQPTSQATGTAAGMYYSIGSNLNTGWTSGDVLLAWLYFSAPTNIDSWANGGLRIGFADNIQNNNSRISLWNALGDDYGSYPYGGWQCIAVDPEITPDLDEVGGAGTNWNNFVSIPNLRAAITKGSPHVVDAIRYGRGRLSVTGTGGTWSELASYNDQNSTATPPGTSSTVVDSGYHRLGLFSFQRGAYLWKGLLQFGTAASAVTWNDGNVGIQKSDNPRVPATFDKIEIVNAGSSVTWSNVTINGVQTSITGVAPTSPGNFEVVDSAATLVMNTCSFTDLGTFILGSGSSLTSVGFRRCGTVTSNGASFTNCPIQNNGTFVVSDLSQLTRCTFTRNDAQSIHAVELTSLGTGTMDWSCIAETGYAAGSSGTFTTANDAGADGAIFVNVASGNLTINVVAGGTIPSIRTAGATVTVQQAVEFRLTRIQPGSEVRLYTNDANLTEIGGGIEQIGITTPGTGWSVALDSFGTYTATYSYSYASDIPVVAVVFDVDYQPVRIEDILEATSKDVRVTQIFDRNYDEGATPFVNP